MVDRMTGHRCCIKRYLAQRKSQRESAPLEPLVGVQVPCDAGLVSTRLRGVIVPLLRKPSDGRASGRLLWVRSATAARLSGRAQPGARRAFTSPGVMNRSKGKPQDGESLMLESLKQWEQGTRSRQIARRSLKGFLEWAVLRGKLIAAYAPPAHIPETRNPSEIGYAIADQEIIELLDLIPKGRTASEEEIYNSWRFAIQLCSVYGLRPEELRHLTIKEGIEGKELWTTYQKSKITISKLL